MSESSQKNKQQEEVCSSEANASKNKSSENSLEEKSEAVAATKDEATAEESDAKKPVKIGALIILILIALSLTWYLVADRYTPYTQQARIDGYVIGVSSEVSGLVRQVWVKNNQTIKTGQKLFEVERSQYEIALNKTLSDLENVKREIESGAAGVESSQSNLEARKANEMKARQDVTRLEALYKKDSGAISIRRLESSQSSYAQAKAKVSGAQAEVLRAMEQKGGEGENNAKLKSATSAVNKAELDLKHTITYAASAGIITDLGTDIGQFTNSGSPLMTFISMNDIWIEAQFTENNLGHMEIGTQVELVIDSLPGKVFHGEIRSIGLGVSVGQKPQAGTLPTIDNNRDWLRQSQRFPVIISFDVKQHESIRRSIRIGGQAEVIAYTPGQVFLNGLAKIYIRIMSYFSYAY